MNQSSSIINFTKSALVDNLKKNVFENFQKAENIASVHENRLFVWKQEHSCILTCELADKKPHSTAPESDFIQVLVPNPPPRFRVYGILTNGIGNRVAVWGQFGVLVIFLPKRVSPAGHFLEHNKSQVCCRSQSIDERYFQKNKYAAIQQLKWHPGSQQDNHLVILTRDKTIKVYKVNDASSDVTLHWSYQIESGPNAYVKQISDDQIVDFDFGLSQVPLESSAESVTDAIAVWKRIVWPIYFIKNSGEVFLLETTIDGAQVDSLPSKIKGPLIVQPPDFEFADTLNFCSIKVMNFDLTILVLATSSGYIYHMISLPEYENEKKTWNNKALKVFESINLNYTILKATMCQKENETRPIKIYVDETNKDRYFVVHTAGIHLVEIGLIEDLKDFLNASPDEVSGLNPSLNTSSNVEYLVCTSVDSTNTNSIVGFFQSFLLNGFTAFLEDGSVVSKPLISLTAPSLIDFDSTITSDHDTSVRQVMKEPFNDYIKKRLATDMQSMTSLKINDQSNINIENKYKAIIQTAIKLQKDHYPKMCEIKNEIQKRHKLQKFMIECQEKELVELKTIQSETESESNEITNRLKQANDKQTQLENRLLKLQFLVSQQHPVSKKNHDSFKNRLVQAEEKVENLKSKMKSLLDKFEYQQAQIEDWKQSKKALESLAIMDSSQYEATENQVSKLAASIQDIRKKVNFLKDELDKF